MLPARAAGLHLGGGVHIPGIAAVTKESAAARSAPPEGRASHARGPRGSVLGSHGGQGTGGNGPLRGTFPSSPGGSSSSSSWNGLEAALCGGHRPCVSDVSDGKHRARAPSPFPCKGHRQGLTLSIPLAVPSQLAQKYDPQKEAELRTWIETVTGQQIGPDFQKGLKDGVILCE